MTKSPSGLRGLLRTLFYYLVGIIMPAYGKRVFLMASLHAQLVQKGVFHEETLDKLNKSLSLARSDATLSFPAFATNAVWDESKIDIVIKDIISDNHADICLPYDEARRVGEQIIALAPAWIRYGTTEEMVRDAVQLFYCQPLRPTA